jgi:ubiquinol-cytochrome c reductase iron-sulfur subunit
VSANDNDGPAVDDGQVRTPPVRVGGAPTDTRLATKQDTPVFAMVTPPVADEADQARGERLASALFLISALGTVGFCVAYVVLNIHHNYGAQLNWALGTCFAIGLLGIGAAMVVWAKKVIPHEDAMEARKDGPSSDEDREKTAATLLHGINNTGIPRRKMLRRTAGLAMGIFPLPLLFALRDLGPAPKDTLRVTDWRAGVRLVDLETLMPVHAGDLALGSIKTVMPEGYQNYPQTQWSLDPTILIRMRPSDIVAPAGRENWSPNGLIAYSKICTHAGCPISLYETQTHRLFCPCHQSTFQVNEGGRVIFGPAARSLPQLPIMIDADGFLRAAGPYAEPVGPSFWERG